VGEMPNLDMSVGDTVETPLADYFAPADCLGRYWENRSSDSLAVAVSVSDPLVLTTAALDVADSVLVTVTYDIGPEGPSHEFLVWVRPHPTGR